jgi:hypothetical protein
VENEENGYPVPDPQKTMINVINESSEAHKQSLKEGTIEKITEKLMEKQTHLTRKYKMHSRNFKTPKIKNLRRSKNN